MMTTTMLDYIDTQANWTSKSLGDLGQHIFVLSKVHIDEIDRALQFVTKHTLKLTDIKKIDFQLPILSQVLEKFSNEVKYGKGFCIIRGLPVRRYSVHEASIIFWGICLYMGNPAPQNVEGDLIYHVKDLHQADSRRYSNTNHPLPFHTDGCDIISLLSYGTASKGGKNYFVSSAAIYNYLLKEMPDLLELLTQPLNQNASSGVICSSFDQYAKQSPFDLPIFNVSNGVLSTRYAAGYIASTIEKSGGSAVTKDQQKALDLLNKTASREDLYYTVQLEPGDMEFFNNNQVFHARDHYEDNEDTDNIRHIIRIWLDAPELNTIAPLFGYRKKN